MSTPEPPPVPPLAQAFVPYDLACPRCGYNLRGQWATDPTGARGGARSAAWSS